MAATSYAVLGQYAGSSWDAAFPQTPQTASLNQDLIHIRNEGNQVLAVVNHAGAVSGGSISSLVLTSVSVASLVLTAVSVATLTLTSVVGSTGVYTGTITGGGSNAFAGKSVIIAGFSTGGNNGTFVVTGSSTTTITVTPTTQADETHAGTAGIVGVTLVTYTGTITGGGTSAFAGKSALIAGFTTSANNGTFLLTDSSTTTLVTTLTAQVAETHAGTAGIIGTTLVTYNGTITGGGASALAGSTAVIAGFTTSANNLTAVITSSTATTLVFPLVAQVNETHAGTAAISLKYVTSGSRIGTFFTRLSSTATVAQLFADAFSNPSQQDIIQLVSPTGESVVNYIDYLGVGH